MYAHVGEIYFYIYFLIIQTALLHLFTSQHLHC